MNRPPLLTVEQALEVLKRLQTAAPPPTADKLAGVIALVQSLSEENAYLNTLLLDHMPDDAPPVARADVPSPAASRDSRTVTDELRRAEALPDVPLLDLFAGLNDALRPPLIAIRGRAELVQAGLLGQITPEQDTWLRAIDDSTARAFAVLDALQEMIALKRGQVRLEIVNFISTDLLTEGWERIKDRVRPYNHDVTILAPEVVPLARGDFYHALVILTDMLDNAIRYTPPGGQIRMSVDNLGTHVLFSVTDNGIGLAPEDLAQVGKPFWRGTQHKLVRQHNGTGLRLFLARQMLELLDGELIFSGEPGLGSTFSFALPAPV